MSGELSFLCSEAIDRRISSLLSNPKAMQAVQLSKGIILPDSFKPKPKEELVEFEAYETIAVRLPNMQKISIEEERGGCVKALAELQAQSRQGRRSPPAFPDKEEWPELRSDTPWKPLGRRLPVSVDFEGRSVILSIEFTPKRGEPLWEERAQVIARPFHDYLISRRFVWTNKENLDCCRAYCELMLEQSVERIVRESALQHPEANRLFLAIGDVEELLGVEGDKEAPHYGHPSLAMRMLMEIVLGRYQI